MISIENVSKSYGARVLFEDVSFRINSRERLGLVGRNGHGKTTLFRMVIGEEHPETGAIVIPRNYRIGHVAQHLRFGDGTVLEEVAAGLPEVEKDQVWKAEKILAGLGFQDKDMARRPEDFSGGYQVRMNLARVLVSDPDLLLLDEPTNYLDITSIRWITRFLQDWPHEIMLITHDRGFMDGLVTHVAGIHRRKVKKIEGNTEKFYQQIAQEEEIYEKTRVNDEKRRKEIELFITRFRAKARLAGMVQSRIKTLSKLEKKDKLEGADTLDFRFRETPLPGKNVMRVEGLTFGYDKKSPPLIKNLSFPVQAGDRICIIGPNGRGKTTLLKLLAGTLKPTKGSISYSPNVETGVYEQTNIQHLHDGRTVEEEVMAAHGDLERQAARNICGAMMFSGDDALKKVSVLSGGEKSRVMLGKILATPVNLLLLDEPSNHLDMDSCDALLAALDVFDGTVIMVTHNEMFLNGVADKLIIFQESGVEVFQGGYADFLERFGWDSEDDGRRKKPRPVSMTRLDKKALKRKRSELIAEKGRVLAPLKKELTALEKKIETLETELADIHQDMVTASEQQNARRITELGRAIHKRQQEIDGAYRGLESVSAQHDALDAEFESRLNELDDTSGDTP
ncbi:MAG: ABC-F family ATP-binding cassette domain-containing protein [Pseudomonadota bacterium]